MTRLYMYFFFIFKLRKLHLFDFLNRKLVYAIYSTFYVLHCTYILAYM